MTFKQFRQWCNERTCDGCWGYSEALLCIEVIRHIDELPFWMRKNAWNQMHDSVVHGIVEPTNRKIQEVMGEKKED